MMRVLRQFASLGLVIAVLSAMTPFTPASAAISSCSVSVSPTSLNTNQGATLTFSVTNNDGGNSGAWVKITRPTSDFTINGGSSSGWSRSVNTDNVTFTGGSLSGGSHNFNVTVQTGITGTSALNWTVEVSDDAGGSSPTTCSGSSAVTIVGDSTSPVISNIQVASVAATSATITWTTDEASNSIVRYGLTTSYGTTANSSALVTSHSVNISGLTAATTYHFRVESTDAASNTGTSSDQTFTTTSEGDNSLVISNISVTNISTSSATITWLTNNVADSLVDYGTTASYGQTQSNGSDVTSHSITLSGLSQSTVYHYKITSQDQIGNTKVTGNNTFTTASPSSSGNGGGGGSSGSSGSGSGSSGPAATPVPAPPAPPTTPTDSGSSGGGGGSSGGGSPSQPAQDTTPPSVQATTDFSAAFSTAPQITGVATDGGAIASVSYSIDGGVNWLSTTSAAGLGTSRVTFSFTPNITEDDNYAIQLRARDASGNVGFSPTYTLVIDQLPPIIGAGLYAVGTAAADITAAIAGFDQIVTLSAVGGPTSINIIATSLSGEEAQTFSLTKNPETGLWSGAISLSEIGDYELSVEATDGANNKTQRKFGNIKSVPGGKITFNESAVVNATVTAHVYNEIIQTFEEWDAAPFGQKNPQPTNERGEFQYILPPGTYYLEIKATGMRPAQTEIFSVDQHTALHPNLALSKQFYLPLGPVALPFPPLFWKQTIPSNIQANTVTVATKEQDVSDTTLPENPLFTSTGPVELRSITSFPALLTFITDWSPYTASQLTHIEQFTNETCKDEAPADCTDVIPILIQSTATRAKLLQDRGRYTNTIYADPTGEFSAALNVNTIPTHIVIGADGLITAIENGVKTTGELKQLTGY